MKDSWLYKTESLDDAIAFRVYRLGRILSVSLTRILEQSGLGLSAEQYFLFFRIQTREGCSQTDLSEKYLNDAPNVTRLLDSLQAKGLIERRPDLSDRRKHTLYSTKLGRQKWKDLVNLIRKERRELYQGITTEDLAQFLSTAAILEVNAIAMTSSGT
ncbi:MAG: MarR family transcriptional regulator [Spirochaetales bacterium]|nr:MarR family transcriptional regulator [Spirochaetales bacterium]